MPAWPPAWWAGGLDIKGLAEWEEIKETRQRELEDQRRLAALEAAEAAREAAESEAQDAVAEAEAIVAEAEQTGEQLQPTPEVEEVVAATEEAAVVVAEVEAIDEEALLEALIRDDEEAKAEDIEPEETISVDDLASFTLDDVMEEDEEEEDLFPDLPRSTHFDPGRGKDPLRRRPGWRNSWWWPRGTPWPAQHGWRSQPGRTKGWRQVTESLPRPSKRIPWEGGYNWPSLVTFPNAGALPVGGGRQSAI